MVPPNIEEKEVRKGRGDLLRCGHGMRSILVPTTTRSCK